MNKRYTNLEKRTKEIGILGINNEEITNGELLFNRETKSVIIIPSIVFDKDNINKFPTLKLQTNTSNNDYIELYFSKDNIYLDVNNRKKFKKLNMSRLFLYEDEYLVSMELIFKGKNISTFKLNNIEDFESFAVISIMTNYGSVIEISINKHRVESKIFDRVNESDLLGAFVLSELIYCNIVFFDEDESKTI